LAAALLRIFQFLFKLRISIVFTAGLAINNPHKPRFQFEEIDTGAAQHFSSTWRSGFLFQVSWDVAELFFAGHRPEIRPAGQVRSQQHPRRLISEP
jgi:hypothetical protein